MSADADGEYPLQTEVPLLFGIEEREDETAAGGIHVDRNVVAGLCIVGIEGFVEGFDVIVQSCPCNTLDRHDTDGVLITHLQGFFGVERGLVECQRHFTHFNLPQLGEFFPYHLETS